MNARRIHRASSFALWLVLSLAGVGVAFGSEDVDEPEWREEEAALPEFPREENLLPFYVSAGTAHRYFVDANSIRVGADGVVRFTLAVKTAGGARNVSFEGIRCATLEHRLYATGRSGGTWTKARQSDWKRIENKLVEGYHAELNRNYFCPRATPIRNAEEGRQALRLGGHPDAN